MNNTFKCLFDISGTSLDRVPNGRRIEKTVGAVIPFAVAPTCVADLAPAVSGYFKASDDEIKMLEMTQMISSSILMCLMEYHDSSLSKLCNTNIGTYVKHICKLPKIACPGVAKAYGFEKTLKQALFFIKRFSASCLKEAIESGETPDDCGFAVALLNELFVEPFAAFSAISGDS